MSLFKEIDHKIENLAIKLNARLSKDRPGYPKSMRTFEERRIDWVDNDIRKAIIIQPNFESKGVNSDIWNFTIIAWFDNERSVWRPRWIENLIKEQEFEIIENNIDSLLKESEEKLVKITMKDLK